jgi:transcriptional regulator with XRE-family HTH domain
MPNRPDPTDQPRSAISGQRPVRKKEATTFPALEPFARRLESVRRERGLTQRAVAERALISTTYYQDIVHGQANPTVIVALRLATALGVQLADLFEAAALQEPPDNIRRVFVADLRDLAITHRRLTEIIKRLAKDELIRAGRRRPRRRGDGTGT